MRRFRLIEPDSFEAACAALEDDPLAKVIGGGTALLILIKHGVYLPGTLVNLAKIPAAAEIAFTPAGELRIGALASLHAVDTHPIVREHYPLLAEACHVVANIRIRNLATVGGNLAHADYQSDPPTALVALGARLELVSSTGVREVLLSEFLLGAYETALQPAELVRAILLPPYELSWHSAYLKFTTRSSEDRPAAGVAARVRMEAGLLADVRVVVGAVTPTPARLTAVEDLVRGQVLSGGLLESVGSVTEAAIEPIDDLRGSASYKRRVVGVLAERAIERCARQGYVQ